MKFDAQGRLVAPPGGSTPPPYGAAADEQEGEGLDEAQE